MKTRRILYISCVIRSTEIPLIEEQFEVIMSGCDDVPATSSHNRMITNLKSHLEADTKNCYACT